MILMHYVLRMVRKIAKSELFSISKSMVLQIRTETDVSIDPAKLARRSESLTNCDSRKLCDIIGDNRDIFNAILQYGRAAKGMILHDVLYARHGHSKVGCVSYIEAGEIVTHRSSNALPIHYKRCTNAL